MSQNLALPGSVSKEQLKKVFDQLDTVGEGKIKLQDLQSQLQDEFSKEQISELIKHVDIDGSGRVDFESFFQACQKSKLDHRMANIRQRNNNDTQHSRDGNGQVPSIFGDVSQKTVGVDRLMDESPDNGVNNSYTRVIPENAGFRVQSHRDSINKLNIEDNQQINEQGQVAPQPMIFAQDFNTGKKNKQGLEPTDTLLQESPEFGGKENRSPIRINDKSDDKMMNLSQIQGSVEVSQDQVSIRKANSQDKPSCSAHKKKKDERNLCQKAFDKIWGVYVRYKQIKGYMKGARLDCSNEKTLEQFEKENDQRSWTRYIKEMIIYTGALYLLVELLVTSINKVGTQKSQSSEFSRPDSIDFGLLDFQNMLEMKFFANMSTVSIEKNMDCHVNGKKQICLNIEAEKCDLQTEDPDKLMLVSSNFSSCMETGYNKIYGDKPIEYCRYAFGNSSAIFTYDERRNWNLGILEKNVFSHKMFQCYQENGLVKEFCDEVQELGYQGEDDTWLLECYKKLQTKDKSNIAPADILGLEQVVECQKSETAQQLYDCISKPTDDINFCHDMFLFDFKKQPSDATNKEIEKCVLSKQKEKKFDNIIPTLKNPISDKKVGVAGFNFFKSPDYGLMLREINQERPLSGSLKCSMLFAEYFTHEMGTAEQNTTANKTLSDAYNCFIAEGFPFYHVGCELKYQMDQYLPHVRDQEYYKSNCMSGTMNYYYPEDKAVYAAKQYNNWLEKYEKTIYPDRAYFKFKDLGEYCTRRYIDIEERLNCKLVTESVSDEFDADFCTQRIFTSSNKLFEYNLVYKYRCLRDRLGNEMYIEEDRQKDLFGCLDDQMPMIHQQKCLEKYEGKLIFITPFDMTFALKILDQSIIFNGEQFPYQLKFVEIVNHQISSFDNEQLEDFVCENTNSLIRLESTLKLPVHLKTIIGQQYMRKIKYLGWYSLHFDPVQPYVDHGVTPTSWSFDNGVHPKKFLFEDWSYNETTRRFIGTCNFPSPYFGLSKYVYDLTFNEEFTEIEDGVRYGYNTEGVLTDEESHYTGGLIAYEYIIHHEVKPTVFKLKCQALRQKSYTENYDNLIAYYNLDIDDYQEEHEFKKKLRLIRNQNETSYQFKLNDKMSFVDIHELSLFKRGNEVNNTLSQPVGSILEVVDFRMKKFFDLLFKTDQHSVGQQEIKPFRLDASTTTRIDKGKEPDVNKQILGFSFGYMDVMRHIIGITPAKKSKEGVQYPEKFKTQANYTLYVGFDFSFEVQKFVYVYFSTLDVVSQLGGIGATLNIVLGFFGPYIVLKFMVEFAKLLTRKAHHKVNLIKIKQIQDQREYIIQKINEKMETNVVDGTADSKKQCEDDLESVQKNGHDDKIAIAILKNAKSTNLESDDEEEDQIEVSYTLTENLVKKWEDIRNKYYPDGDTFAKKTIMQRLAQSMTQDKFQQQQVASLRQKMNFYQTRSTTGLNELIQLAQYRLSLFNIFNLSDEILVAGIKTKKLKNQLKFVKQTVDNLKEAQSETNKRLMESQEEIECIRGINYPHESIGVIQSTPDKPKGRLISGQIKHDESINSVPATSPQKQNLGLGLSPGTRGDAQNAEERTKMILDLKALINDSPNKKI